MLLKRGHRGNGGLSKSSWARLSAKSRCTFKSMNLNKVGSIESLTYGLQKIESSGRKRKLAMLNV